MCGGVGRNGRGEARVLRLRKQRAGSLSGGSQAGGGGGMWGATLAGSGAEVHSGLADTRACPLNRIHSNCRELLRYSEI